MATTDLKSANFDCVILPGGFEAPDRVRLLPEVQVFVREMDEQKKLVAAICHGPWIMISAEICRGRKMTAFWSIEADIKNSGADYQHKVPVVIDDNFITSPHYNNNGDFMKAVIKYLSN
jgi:protease I